MAHIVVTDCRNCNRPIWFIRCPDTTWEVHHDGCDFPTYHVKYTYPTLLCRMEVVSPFTEHVNS